MLPPEKLSPMKFKESDESNLQEEKIDQRWGKLKETTLVVNERIMINCKAKAYQDCVLYLVIITRKSKPVKNGDMLQSAAVIKQF